MHFKCSAIIVLLLATASFSFAQRTINGTIKDASTNEPLIGANILVLGTSSGTVSDFDGNFELQVPEGSTQLRVSYTGYAAQDVDVASGTTFNITLVEGSELDEVVVTGYGTLKSREVTSSITSIKAEDFNKGNISNPSQLLQGKVAGLTISRPGGDPNGNFNIRLRGLGSLGANSSPLVVIDGVLGADLNSVDPNDIASIDVLKDASAAAIYGTRGGQGVILITTKTGESGKTSVNYEGLVTADFTDRYQKVLSPSDYRSFRGGVQGDIKGTDLGSSTEWFDAITETGISHVHSLSLSGGSKGTTYRVSGNFRDVKGVAINTGFQRLNGRVNLSQKALNDRLTIDANYTTTTINADYGFNEAFRYATIYNPTAPIISNAPANAIYDGYFQQTLFDYYNPVAILEQNTNEGENRNSIASLRGTFNLLKGWDVSAFYSQERRDFTGQVYYDKNSFFRGRDRNGLASQRNDKNTIDLFEATTNYAVSFGNTELKLLGGYSFQEFENFGFRAEGGNIISDAFGFNNFNAAQDFKNGLGTVESYRNSERLIAFFGRANLNFDDTYYITASLRQEGSSRFGDNNKWGTFPGISAGVNLAKLFDIAGVDNLKLRAGYGEVGNRPGNSYISLQRFTPGSSFFYNGNYVPSYGPASNANPDLKWEVKRDINIGVDFALADFLVTGSVDYFNTSTQDLIYPIGVPVPPNQFGTTELNIGEIQNSGLEFVANVNAVKKDNFTWTTSVNGTYFIGSELLEFLEEANGFRDVAVMGAPGQSDIPIVRVQEGSPLGQIWGLQYLGVSAEGKWLYADNDKNGTGGDNTDRAVIGNGLPDFQLGWNNTFTFGDFDFNFFLRGTFGHDLVNTFRGFYEAPQSITSYNLPETVKDIKNLSEAPKFSSFHVENASFLKLDNATLGYTIGLPSGSAFNKVRLYLNALNLFTITDYTGADPEVRLADTDSNPPNALAPGIDRRDTYFTTRAVTFGLQLGF
jgi:iron complex outermembrane receptor protein